MRGSSGIEGQGWKAGAGLVSGFFLALLLAGCAEETPIKVGFIGGTSGRVADLGIAGRHGVQLAIETANQNGGIKGRPIELILRDDEQDAALAVRRYKELADEKVVAIIGPMTSSMAVAVLPEANARRLFTLSPTATANELGGKDDAFFRVISPTQTYASLSARYHFDMLGVRRMAVLLDLRNKAYTESWAGDFRAAFERAGGEVVWYRGFESGDEAGLAGLAEQALNSGADGVVLVANSVDAALMTQQIRLKSTKVHISMSEWAATERFIELAGRAAEGVVAAQFFDRDSEEPSYRGFRRRYQDRFGEAPGFASVAGYDAAQVLIAGLSQNATPEGLKPAILAIGTFAGAQGEIKFSATGDADRPVFVTVVRDGRFVQVPRDQVPPLAAR